MKIGQYKIKELTITSMRQEAVEDVAGVVVDAVVEAGLIIKKRLIITKKARKYHQVLSLKKVLYRA